MEETYSIDDPVVQSTTVRSMFDSIADRYDLGNSVLSMGIHHAWRRVFLKMLKQQRDATVLDLCTGTGDLIKPLRDKYQDVYGADFSAEMLKSGISCNKIDSDFGKLSVVQSDAHALAFKNDSFDVVTVAFGVRNFADRKKGLTEIRRILKPGGQVGILEFGQPWLPGFNALYNWYSRWVMPVIGGLLTGNRAAYSYLPNTAKNFPCGDQFQSVLEEVGFSNIRWRSLSLGIAYCYVGDLKS